MTRLHRWSPWAYLLGMWVLAAWLRLRGTSMAMVLSDQLGPWWVAVAGPPWFEPHAPPYGWGLYLPYWIIVSGADSLWSAVQSLLVVHAAIAPITFGAAWWLVKRGGSWIGAGIASLGAALDPGLIQTALHGAESYLASVWVASMTLGLCARFRPWGPFVAIGSYAMAVMNHPVALFTFPMLLWLPWRERRVQWSLIFGAVLLFPRVIWIMSHELPNMGGLTQTVDEALLGWWQEGPAALVLALLGVVVGWKDRTTRGLAMGVLGSLAMLLLAGFAFGYLRDYHLRIIVAPALACWAGMSGLKTWAGLLLCGWPADPIEKEHLAFRPGGLGLANAFSQQIQALDAPVLMVDGAWLSASPAVEPSALTLDLWLRGRPIDGFGPTDEVLIIVSAERGEAGGYGDIDMAQSQWAGPMLYVGDRYFLGQASVEAVRLWSKQVCDALKLDGREPLLLGGAWDGLVGLQPQTRTEELEAWWDCP